MRRIERQAFDLAQESLREGRPDSGRLVGIHAQAARPLSAALALALLAASLVWGGRKGG